MSAAHQYECYHHGPVETGNDGRCHYCGNEVTLPSRAVLNLTQHAATPAQVAAGVVDLPPLDRMVLVEWLTFKTLPTPSELTASVRGVCQLAEKYTHKNGKVMLGGAPFLMHPLHSALLENYCRFPVYAFSRRVSEEQTQPDGTVSKVSSFSHEGFV